MNEGLSDLWGLGEAESAADPSEAQQQARASFDEAIGAVNEGLKSAAANAAPEEHAALDAERSKLYEAFQVASSQFGGDSAYGQSAVDRVVAAAGSLGGKAAKTAESAAAAHQQWDAKEEQFDDMARQINELADAGHPKSDTLQQLAVTIREKSDSRCFGDCNAAVEELGPKLDAMLQEHRAMIEQAAAGTPGEGGDESWFDAARGAVSDVFSFGNDEASSALELEPTVFSGSPASRFNMEEEHGDFSMEDEHGGWNMEDEHGEQDGEDREGGTGETEEKKKTVTIRVPVFWSSAGSRHTALDGTQVSISPAAMAGQVTVSGGAWFPHIPADTYTVTATGKSINGPVSQSATVTLEPGDDKTVELTLVGVPAAQQIEKKGTTAGQGDGVQPPDCSYDAVEAFLLASDPGFRHKHKIAYDNYGRKAAALQENIRNHILYHMQRCRLGQLYVPPKKK